MPQLSNSGVTVLVTGSSDVTLRVLNASVNESRDVLYQQGMYFRAGA